MSVPCKYFASLQISCGIARYIYEAHKNTDVLGYHTNIVLLANKMMLYGVLMKHIKNIIMMLLGVLMKPIKKINVLKIPFLCKCHVVLHSIIMKAIKNLMPSCTLQILHFYLANFMWYCRIYL